jgi:predicted RNA-binding Zn-ribbon protein involved in translation (DUF1610 family)
MEPETRITVLFRCRNPLCGRFDQPTEQFVTRTVLREMSQPESMDRFMCPACGQTFVLTEQEKKNNLEMLGTAS